MTGLIVALDFKEKREALNLLDQLDPKHCALKVGNEMFSLYGPQWVRELIKLNFKVFLDLKFHDIPNTVARACTACADLGVWMLNVHASGGLAMLEAAREAVNAFGLAKPLLIGVTILTHFSPLDLPSIGLHGPLDQQALKLAKLAYQAGLDGIVSSAFEVPSIKAYCGSSFLAVTPGIRLTPEKTDDQTRIITPREAKGNGCDFIVVGRPITQSEQPDAVLKQILNDLS